VSSLRRIQLRVSGVIRDRSSGQRAGAADLAVESDECGGARQDAEDSGAAIAGSRCIHAVSVQQ
jgi:hypothetical protein